MKKKEAENKNSMSISSTGRWLAVGVIVLAGLIVYSNNYNNVWLFDDYQAIVDNPMIRDPLSLQFWLHPADTGTGLVGRPVAAMTFALNYALGGFDVRGYHLFNNIIHILAALTLFDLIRYTLLLPRFVTLFRDRANWYSLTVALLWVVHPLQTESVTYIVCRTESLMALFYVMTLYFAARSFQSTRPRGWYTAAVVSCVLGMGSKEVMVSAPLLVFLYDYLFVSDTLRTVLRSRKGFYAALAATWSVLVFYQIGMPHGPGVSFNDPYLGVLDYFRTQMTVIVHYLRLFFWPHPLVLDSQDWPIVRGWSSVLIIPGILLCTMFTLTVWGIIRKTWWSLLGVAFFAVLAPTSSIIPLLGEIVSERRMYLPLAVVIVFVVFVTDHFWRKGVDRVAPEKHVLRFVPVVLAVGTIAGMGYMTWERNQDYRNAVTIWQDTVIKRPGNYRAQENLGKALGREGKLHEAEQKFREAVRLFPANKQPELGLGEIYSMLGTTLSQLGKVQDALRMHEKSVELQPGDSLIYYRLGNTYLRANDLDNAAVAFQRAVVLAPGYYQAHGNLAIILMQKGMYEQAEYHVRELIKFNPDRADSLSMLADLRIEQGQYAEALKILREALTMQPENQRIKNQLNSILAIFSQ